MKPSILKGTRDFGPLQTKRRNYIFQVVKDVFTRYGFDPIETPAMENLDTLTGKYGEEGDQLLFKVLNNGDYLAKANTEALENKDSKKLTSSISKRGLRYDLTVPFARFVSMNQTHISFPFKRYQIQPVWRADRPSKGRYQEFYQCDVDVVGSNSLMYEAELCCIYDDIFKNLGIGVEIRINNRKILEGLAECSGISEHFQAMTICIDKLDKIGADKVKEEMEKRGISSGAADQVLESLKIKEISILKDTLAQSELGLQGIQEIEEVFNYLGCNPRHNQIVFDPTLARGLNYYTGCIFEVAGLDVEMGSLGGGGRYDNLTDIFGLKNVSGVGVSLGAERIYDIMVEKELFPDAFNEQMDLLLIALDEEAHLYAYEKLVQLRNALPNKRIDLYPEASKLKKQMKYANARNARFVAIIGSEERQKEVFSLKNMHSGDQSEVDLSQLLIQMG